MNVHSFFSANPNSPPDDSESTVKALNILSVLKTLWRRKIRILTAGLFCVGLGAIYSFIIAVPHYTAQTTLILQMKQDRVNDLESVFSNLPTELSSLNTQIHVIKSRHLLSKLIERLELDSDPEFSGLYSGFRLSALLPSFMSPAQEAGEPIEVIANVSEAIDAHVQRNSYLFVISATSIDPLKAADISNSLAQIYLEDQVNTKFNLLETSVGWLSNRVSELEVELKQREAAIASLRAESTSPSANSLTRMDIRLNDTRRRIGDLEAQLNALEQNPAENSSLQLREKPRLIAQRNALMRSAKEQADLILKAGADSAQMRQLEREADATRVLYNSFLTRLKELTVRRGLQQTDSRILSKADRGYYVAPQKTLILLGSFLFGSILASMIVLMRQYLHNGIRTAYELEAETNLPVLGQIPIIPIETNPELINFLACEPTSITTEAVRNLRTSLLMSDIDNPPKVIVSTSSLPGEGKTTQSIALAHNLAGLKKKVLLIEGDMRRRSLTEYFAPMDHYGLVSVLSGTTTLKNAVYHSEQLECDVLLGELSHANAADMFSSRAFNELMVTARSEYDFIVIDTPPVLIVPDARVIAQHADSVIYTVAWDSTKRSQISEGLRQFSIVKVPVSGMVLSQVDPIGMARFGYIDGSASYTELTHSYFTTT